MRLAAILSGVLALVVVLMLVQSYQSIQAAIQDDAATAEIDGDNAFRPPSTPEPTKSPPDMRCPRLAPGFRYLIDSPDPLAVADAARIERQGDRIRVELRTRADDQHLISNYDVIVVVRSPMAPYVVVFAPISKLCAMSNDPAIEYIQREDPPLIGPPGRPNL